MKSVSYNNQHQQRAMTSWSQVTSKTSLVTSITDASTIAHEHRSSQGTLDTTKVKTLDRAEDCAQYGSSKSCRSNMESCYLTGGQLTDSSSQSASASTTPASTTPTRVTPNGQQSYNQQTTAGGDGTTIKREVIETAEQLSPDTASVQINKPKTTLTSPSSDTSSARTGSSPARLDHKVSLGPHHQAAASSTGGIGRSFVVAPALAKLSPDSAISTSPRQNSYQHQEAAMLATHLTPPQAEVHSHYYQSVATTHQASQDQHHQSQHLYHNTHQQTRSMTESYYEPPTSGYQPATSECQQDYWIGAQQRPSANLFDGNSFPSHHQLITTPEQLQSGPPSLASWPGTTGSLDSSNGAQTVVQQSAPGSPAPATLMAAGSHLGSHHHHQQQPSRAQHQFQSLSPSQQTTIANTYPGVTGTQPLAYAGQHGYQANGYLPLQQHHHPHQHSQQSQPSQLPHQHNPQNLHHHHHHHHHNGNHHHQQLQQQQPHQHQHQRQLYGPQTVATDLLHPQGHGAQQPLTHQIHQHPQMIHNSNDPTPPYGSSTRHSQHQRHHNSMQQHPSHQINPQQHQLHHSHQHQNPHQHNHHHHLNQQQSTGCHLSLQHQQDQKHQRSSYVQYQARAGVIMNAASRATNHGTTNATGCLTVGTEKQATTPPTQQQSPTRASQLYTSPANSIRYFPTDSSVVASINKLPATPGEGQKTQITDSNIQSNFAMSPKHQQQASSTTSSVIVSTSSQALCRHQSSSSAVSTTSSGATSNHSEQHHSPNGTLSTVSHHLHHPQQPPVVSQNNLQPSMGMIGDDNNNSNNNHERHNHSVLAALTSNSTLGDNRLMDTEQDSSKESQLSQLHLQCDVILNEQKQYGRTTMMNSNSPNQDTNNGTEVGNNTTNSANNGSSSGNTALTTSSTTTTTTTTTTSSTTGRSKRLRTSFKHNQLKEMKKWFAKNQNPDAKDLKTLSQTTQLSKRVLQVWFQNARAKHRRNVAKANQQIYDVNQHASHMLQFQAPALPALLPPHPPTSQHHQQQQHQQQQQQQHHHQYHDHHVHQNRLPVGEHQQVSMANVQQQHVGRPQHHGFTGN